MPQPIDLRAEILKLREKLKRRTTRQKFLSLEEWMAPLRMKSARDLVKSEDGRLWLTAMARVFAGLYVHLPFKQTRYAANPVESLQALERNLPLPPADFNQALLSIFRELRDAHTQYQLPPPYAATEAFLPFEIAAACNCQYDPEQIPTPLFYVTYVARALEPQLKAVGFARGARVTHWNGMPIEHAVHQIALRANGANADAQFAGTMRDLTNRPLHRLPIPESPLVTLRFYPAPPQDRESKDGQETKKEPDASEVIFEWSVRRRKPGEPAESLQSLLWDLKEEGWKEWPHLEMSDVAYQVQSFAHPTASEPVPVGMIRLRRFPRAELSFVNAFRDLLEELQKRAPLALIIDVRGNAGGSIPSAERLLQMLTPGPVTPVSFQFRNTPLLHRIIDQDDNERSRRGEFGLDTDEGTVFSRSAGLTTEAAANNIGQCYYGRVALITDALCFSAGDIFAAGFQDHRIGPVIGVHASTGAGGANRWDYNTNVVGKKTEDGWTFPPLPEGANMLFSVRHCLRTGRFQGKVLEDFGVEPDHRYLITEKDLFEYDTGLYEFAFSKLLWGAGLKEISLDLQVTWLPTFLEDDERLRIDCQTAGVVHAELLVNGQIVQVGELREEGSRWSRETFSTASVQDKRVETVEVRCYNTMPAELFPFFPETERVPDAGKKVPRLVASRKFVMGGDSIRDGSEPQFPRGYPAPGDRRHRLLYYVRGCGRKDALDALTIVNELRSLLPDVEVRFVSHGRGAETLRELGSEVIDLNLPNHPPLFAVQETLATSVKALESEFRPLMMVSHGEACLAVMVDLDGREPDWPCPCVLIVNDLEGVDLAQLIHREILVLGAGSIDLVHRVRPVGPIVRALRYQRKDKARADLGLPEGARLISVMVGPGGDNELEAPIYALVKSAFDLLPQEGKQLLWDPAAGVKEGPFFNAADYDRVMAASDLVITKGDPAVITELRLARTPYIMLSHSGQTPPLFFEPTFEDHWMLPYAGLDAATLSQAMAGVLHWRTLNPVTMPPELQNGARNAAARLRELLLDIESFGDEAILAQARQLAEKKINIAEFRSWFDVHDRWLPESAERSPLAQAVAAFGWTGKPPDHLDENAAQAWVKVIQAFDAH